MIKRLLQIFTPFAVIAKELTILRELYEADLASRETPVIRITQSPKKSDTEVFYGDDSENKGNMVERIKQALNDAWTDDEP